MAYLISMNVSLCIWKTECILQGVLANTLIATPQTEALSWIHQVLLNTLPRTNFEIQRSESLLLDSSNFILPTHTNPLGWSSTFTKLPKSSHCQNWEHLSPAFPVCESPHLALVLGQSWTHLKGPFSIHVLFVFCLEYLRHMFTFPLLLRFISFLGWGGERGETDSLHSQG